MECPFLSTKVRNVLFSYCMKVSNVKRVSILYSYGQNPDSVSIVTDYIETYIPMTLLEEWVQTFIKTWSVWVINLEANCRMDWNKCFPFPNDLPAKTKGLKHLHHLMSWNIIHQRLYDKYWNIWRLIMRCWTCRYRSGQSECSQNHDRLTSTPTDKKMPHSA